LAVSAGTLNSRPCRALNFLAAARSSASRRPAQGRGAGCGASPRGSVVAQDVILRHFSSLAAARFCVAAAGAGPRRGVGCVPPRERCSARCHLASLLFSRGGAPASRRPARGRGAGWGASPRGSVVAQDVILRHFFSRGGAPASRRPAQGRSAGWGASPRGSVVAQDVILRHFFSRGGAPASRRPARGRGVGCVPTRERCSARAPLFLWRRACVVRPARGPQRGVGCVPPRERCSARCHLASLLFSRGGASASRRPARGRSAGWGASPRGSVVAQDVILRHFSSLAAAPLRRGGRRGAAERGGVRPHAGAL
jgi:hypothetical protein